MGQCNLLIDRHVHKNAGTSIRQVMQQLMDFDVVQVVERHGAITADEWVRLLRGLESALVEPCSEALARTVVAIEAHDAAVPWDVFMLALQRYRASKRTCCRVVLSTRTREPLDHYVSFYRWGVQPRYAAFNKTFIQWAPANLQSTLLLRARRPVHKSLSITFPSLFNHL